MRLAISTITFLILAGCAETSDWHGWVYPNKNQLVEDIPIGQYPSLEACRNSAKNILRYVVEEDQVGDYECGYKCTLTDDPMGLNVCEKTER